MTDNSGSAFPVLDEGKAGAGNLSLIGSGLTKREHYAAKCMAAVIISCHDVPVTPEQMACDAVRYADALITALKGENQC